MEEWPEGPLLLGVGWDFSERLVRTAAGLADALCQLLVCVFLDPARDLTEWESVCMRTGHSRDTVINVEAASPSGKLLDCLASILAEPGEARSFRLLNGDVAKSLIRLAESTGATL